MKYFFIKTFGCQMNIADSEKIHMLLLSAGMRKVLDPLKADIVILNTCSVRQKGEDRVFGFMNAIKRAHRDAGTMEKMPFFGITGCMVRKTGIAKHHGGDNNSTKQAHPLKRNSASQITFLSAPHFFVNYDDPLFLRSPLIDFTFRIEEVMFITKILSFLTDTNIGNDEKLSAYLAVKQFQENPTSANIIIQTGCDNYCTYCIVPYTRGREYSRSQDEIVAEVKKVIANGTQEVTLLGQNVNSYGKETRAKLWNADMLTWQSSHTHTPFRDLLEAINAIDGIKRIRFTSSNPHDMTKDILDAHFELEHLCPYLHFALQSGSDATLSRMNRKHTYIDFKKQVEYLRSKNPLFAISTDIIVGFPGETEDEFQKTVQAMQEIQFDFAYIARYSVRSGTFAEKRFIDDISPSEKARRWSVLNDILQQSVQTRSQMMVGRTEEIFISGKGKTGGWVGRTRNFKEVYIDDACDMQVGTIVTVKIVALDGWILRGEII